MTTVVVAAASWRRRPTAPAAAPAPVHAGEGALRSTYAPQPQPQPPKRAADRPSMPVSLTARYRPTAPPSKRPKLAMPDGFDEFIAANRHRWEEPKAAAPPPPPAPAPAPGSLKLDWKTVVRGDADRRWDRKPPQRAAADRLFRTQY